RHSMAEASHPGTRRVRMTTAGPAPARGSRPAQAPPPRPELLLSLGASHFLSTGWRNRSPPVSAHEGLLIERPSHSSSLAQKGCTGEFKHICKAKDGAVDDRPVAMSSVSTNRRQHPSDQPGVPG